MSFLRHDKYSYQQYIFIIGGDPGVRCNVLKNVMGQETGLGGEGACGQV